MPVSQDSTPWFGLDSLVAAMGLRRLVVLHRDPALDAVRRTRRDAGRTHAVHSRERPMNRPRLARFAYAVIAITIAIVVLLGSFL